MSSPSEAQEHLTVAQLRAVARERGLTGYSKLKKNELLELLFPKLPLPPQRKRASSKKRNSPRKVSEEKSQEKENSRINKNFTAEFLSLRSRENHYVSTVQLGKEGKEGTVYLVVDSRDPTRRYAMKTFRKRKSGETLEKEAFFQHLGYKVGVSPRIIEYNMEEKYFIMEVLDRTLPEVIRDQKGVLTDAQQTRILQIYQALDQIGVVIGDTNPLNLMVDKTGKFFAIDYGFGKWADHRDYRDHLAPNSEIMPLGLLIWMKEKGFNLRGMKILAQKVPAEIRRKMNLE